MRFASPIHKIRRLAVLPIFAGLKALLVRPDRPATCTIVNAAFEVREAFLEVLAGREQLALQQEAEKIALELADITRQRVAAGELAATEETRAEARRAETTAEAQKRRRLLAEAELNLAAALAVPEGSSVTAAPGELPREVMIPEREVLLADVQSSPLLGLRQSEVKLAAAGLALEQANAWSDTSLSLALREFSGSDARAVGVSIPLPLFRRNQSELAEAGALARKAAANEEAARRRLRTELSKAHTVLAAADQEARILVSRVKELETGRAG